MNLSDIRREAAALECDIDTSSGYLDIYKRGDRTILFCSFQDADDRRTLQAAWDWLQRYRKHLDELDGYRSRRPGLGRRRSSYARFAIQSWVLAALLIGVITLGWYSLHVLDEGLGILISCAVFLATAFLTRRK